MTRFIYLLILIALGVRAQDKSIPSHLLECYADKYLLQRENRLPHTLNTFLSILRKIENVEGLNMDLRMLSVALLHRFRADGIVRTSLDEQNGIVPYAVDRPEFYRHLITLKYIPGNAVQFPNNSITDIERCTLHFMLSDTIETIQRGDEATVCKSSARYRYARDAKVNNETDGDVKAGDVETFTPAEIEKNDPVENPNLMYPDKERMQDLPQSKCPVHSGVVKTPWGTTAFGLVLAGIAAATEPQENTVYNLQRYVLKQNISIADANTKVQIHNDWFATLAGDLAEVALLQGPFKESKKMSVGVDGAWNSTALPRWFFLTSDEDYAMTAPEIRGDLDGLILATELNKGYSNRKTIRLSQIFDMYYSRQGFFDSAISACNRKTLFTAVAPNTTMSNEAYGAAVLLSKFIAKGIISSKKMEEFAVRAVNTLVSFVPTMDNDISCESDKNVWNSISTDLTIILDTNWEFSQIKPVLANLLESVDVNPYNSNYTLINGEDGTVMIQSTSSILDFYSYNSSMYQNLTKGFNLPKSLKELEKNLLNKLDNERSRGIGGARSDVVLIIPQTNSISNGDKEYCVQTLARLREKVPDTTILIATSISKDTWSDLVKHPENDLITISVGDTQESARSMAKVASRIRQVPKRLINTQCGSTYQPSGTSNSYDDYILPSQATIIYKLDPNYFYQSDKSSTLNIKSSSSGSLVVCWARELLRPDNDTVQSKSCKLISPSETHGITVSCSGASYIHECAPLYISVTSNSTSSFQCTDAQVCRYPNMIQYTISYKDLVCASDATKIAVNSFLLMIVLVFFNL